MYRLSPFPCFRRSRPSKSSKVVKTPDRTATPTPILTPTKPSLGDLFFALPLEIRLQIYLCLLRSIIGYRTHIVTILIEGSTHEHLTHIECIGSMDYFFPHPTPFTPRPGGIPRTFDSCCHSKYTQTRPQTHFMGMLLICKQMYSEMIEVVYNKSTFTFFNLNTLHLFLSRVPSKRLKMLSSVEISCQLGKPKTPARYVYNQVGQLSETTDVEEEGKWANVCMALTRMPALQSLLIEVQANRPLDIEFFKTLIEVKVKRKFVVEAPFGAEFNGQTTPFVKVGREVRILYSAPWRYFLFRHPAGDTSFRYRSWPGLFGH